MLEKFFKLKENGTNVKTEIIAGITSFMTMAYILAVNPSIMSAAGMDHGAVFTATALAAFIGTLAMALFANYPFALAPGMGLNAYFAYTVVLGMGYSWQYALAAVFAEGIIFIVLSLTNVREAIFNAIPQNLKSAVSVGIGLFIAFIGLQNAHIVIGGSTLLQLFSVDGYNEVNGVSATFHDVGITVLLAIIGIIITGALVIKNVKGNILWGILITWALGLICQGVGLYVPNPDLGFYTLIPDFSNGLSIPSIAPIFCKMDFSGILSLNFVVILFAFLFVDMFDTIGTLIGVSTKAGMLDKDGKLPRIKGALLADAVGTVFGAAIGTSTVTSFVESSSGVGVGGRTGLTAVTAGVLFILSIFISPLIISAITNAVTAPALVVVGVMMAQQLKGIDWDDLMIASAAFLTVLVMVLGYSISNGIAIGFVVYTVGMIGAGKAKDIHPSVWILDVIFLIYFWVTFA